MPAPIDLKKKAAVRQAYIDGCRSAPELAIRFDASKRTIQNWIKTEGWDTEARNKDSGLSQLPNDFGIEEDRVVQIRGFQSHKGRPIGLAESMIDDLRSDFKTTRMDDRKAAAIISREIREWAKFQCELMEPTTAADFANELLTSGVSIREFVSVLKEKSQPA